MCEGLSMAIVELKKNEALDMVKKGIEKGQDALDILKECRKGMSIVGDRYKKEEYFLSELMLSAAIFKEAMDILEPYMNKMNKARSDKPLGKVVIATLKGDIHDLGKNIFCTLLKAQSFAVYDLGVNVDPAIVVEKVKSIKPDFVGFSALMTTSFESLKQAVEMLKEAGLRDQLKIMVGGGVTTATVKEHIGADFQTLDATEGVTYCMQIIKKGV